MMEGGATPACWLEETHDTIVMCIIDSCDLRTRMAVLCTCKRMKQLCERPELWRRVVFDSADEQRGLKAERLLSVLGRARGGVEVLQLARTPEARSAEQRERFSDGLKVGQLLPHTLGAGALGLASLAPRLRHLSIDERASCLGGMTDDLARALGAKCPSLERLEVFFGRYSLPAELLGDDGLIKLTEGCRSLKALVLVNVDGVSDRCLYAVAANCRGLRELVIGGYSESITDAGLGVLVEAARELRVLRLGGKLLKATDATLRALSRGGGGGSSRSGGGVGGSSGAARPLERVQLTRGMTLSGALRALAAACPALVELDARHALTAAELGGGGRGRTVGGRGGAFSDDDEDAAALAALARACPRLSRVALPPAPPSSDDEVGGGRAGSSSGSARVSSSSGDVDDEDDDRVGGGGGGAGDLYGWRIASHGVGARAGSCVPTGGGGGGGGVRLLQAADVAALVALAAGR